MPSPGELMYMGDQASYTRAKKRDPKFRARPKDGGVRCSGKEDEYTPELISGTVASHGSSTCGICQVGQSMEELVKEGLEWHKSWANWFQIAQFQPLS